MSRIFEHRSKLSSSVEEVVAFHQKPEALQMLTPLPIIVRLRRDDRVSLHEGEVAFTLWFGFFPVRWLSRHEPGPIENSFVDWMVEGPMLSWRHEHLFEAMADGVMLVDRITLQHKPGWRGWLTRLMFDGLALRFLFIYRHWRTKRALR